MKRNTKAFRKTVQGRMNRPHKAEQSLAGMNKIYTFLGFELQSVDKAEDVRDSSNED